MTHFPILVCGGRDYEDEDFVFETLNQLREKHGPLHIIQGGASGADALAALWAVRQPSVRMSQCPADWKTHGRAAGPICNTQMLSEHAPKLVVAFDGGAGTADMVNKAREAGIEVLEPKKR